MNNYDLIIVGAGPAGLNASVYASRYGLKNIIIGEVSGGLVTQTNEIGNWLGEKNITGYDFTKRAVEHVKSLGAEILPATVNKIKKKGTGFKLILSNGQEFTSKTVLIAVGSTHRKLGVVGEEELLGKGVSYCATCDGFFYRNKTVAIVGGSDSAVSAGLFLSNIANRVYLIYRKDKLRAEKFWIDLIEKNKNVTIIYNTNIKKIVGGDRVEKIKLDKPFNGHMELKVAGVFIEIGFEPNVEMARKLGVKLDKDEYIKVDNSGKTSVAGIWAAGDITTGSNKFKQIITAAAEGAIAVNDIQNYLKNSLYENRN